MPLSDANRDVLPRTLTVLWGTTTSSSARNATVATHSRDFSRRPFNPCVSFCPQTSASAPGTKPNSVSVQVGDLSWSSVRGSGAGPGRGRGGRLRGRGRGSHLDGTEDALHQSVSGPSDVGPSGYEVVERPADISSEVHLTTVSPLSALGATAPAAESEGSEADAVGPGPSEEAVALYYKSTGSPERDDDGAEEVPRKRGRVRYGDRRRRKRPRVHDDVEARRNQDDDDDTARSSAEPHGQQDAGDDAIGVVKQDAPADIKSADEELAQETNRLLEELKESKAVRKRLRKRPRIMTETGHILRGVQVKETLKADKWDS